MSLPALSIKRHVLAYMLSAVLVLFGVISYERLGIDRLPRVEFPVLTVTTVLRGANPDIIDASITNIIESQLNTVSGIEHIQSASSPSVSVISLTFELEKDINIAFDEVQAKVNQVLRQLPADIEPPIVSKVETNAQPVMWLSLRGDRTLQQLNQYARNVVKKRLETIDGVGEVRLGGKRDRNIRVNIKPERMAALHVTTQDIINAFRDEHVQVPGGFLVSDKTESLLKLDFESHSLNELQHMIITYRENAPVRLQDVASIEDGLEDFRQLAHFNGQSSIGLGIVKIANTNTVEIIAEVKRRLEKEITPQLPAGMTITISSDDSIFIMEMVKTLKEHLLLGTLLAALVVWLFLRSIRSTLIIAVAIPVSLMGAVAAIYFAGYTFNSMTLLAMLLLVGVVVDDAIVVLENIFRHREEGDTNPVNAAITGASQVQFAVLASSLTLVSIFAPVVFMGGIIGRFFEAFSVVVTIGVLVSLLVSLTLTPMLCSRHLKVSRQHSVVYRTFETLFNKLDSAYRWLLDLALRFRWSVVFVTLLIVISSAWFFVNVGKSFVPEEDEGRFMVFIKTPLGSNIEYTNSRLEKIEAVLGSHKEIATYFTAVGLGQAGQVNQGLAFVRLVPRDQRAVKQSDLVATVRKELMQIPGVRAFATSVPPIGGMRGEPLQFVVTGPNLTEIGRLSTVLQEKLSAQPGLGRLDVDLQLDLPQIEMTLDKVRVAELGLNSREVAQAVNVMSGGLDVARYNDVPGDGERYDIRLKAAEGEFKQLSDFSKIYLRGREGQMVRLDVVAKFHKILGPAIISRYDMQYAANFAGSPSVPLGDAVKSVQQAAAEVLPAGYTIKFTGQAEQFSKTIEYAIFAFGLALVLVYMVLASQFNSFIQPFMIMIAQPLAIIGGVAALWLFDHTLNIYSMIGLILLIGLVAKNSILLIDLTNQLRNGYKASAQISGQASDANAGKNVYQEVDAALREACPVRMRPVLMTSLTIILALVPAALGIGAGSDTNGPLAVAVIGGMISSTLLTLLVVPAVYSLVENALVRWQAKRAAAVSSVL